MLATPLNALILSALVSGPKTQTEMRRESGSPAQSTLRSHLHGLEKAKVIGKRKREAFPGTLEYELEEAGTELRFVTETLQRWLTSAPQGALELGGEPARSAVKALTEAWTTTMASALAVQPQTLTEMARLIPEVSYPSLERRLATMHAVGQIEMLPSGPRGTPYALTGWLRHGIAPLAAAADWERHNGSSESAQLCRLDVEAAFVLVLPLMDLPANLVGECRLAVEIPSEDGGGLESILAHLEGGDIGMRDNGAPDNSIASATGSAQAWFSSLIEANSVQLVLGGDSVLAQGLLDVLHSTLFGLEGAKLHLFPNKTD